MLLTYLVKNGSERVVTSAREHLYDLRQLETYSYHDEHGKDHGINGSCYSLMFCRQRGMFYWGTWRFFSVRQKTKDLMEFIQDDERLREERKKAKKNKDKYTGMGCVLLL